MRDFTHRKDVRKGEFVERYLFWDYRQMHLSYSPPPSYSRPIKYPSKINPREALSLRHPTISELIKYEGDWEYILVGYMMEPHPCARVRFK